jgi:hypothetical protein
MLIVDQNLYCSSGLQVSRAGIDSVDGELAVSLRLPTCILIALVSVIFFCCEFISIAKLPTGVNCWRSNYSHPWLCTWISSVAVQLAPA